MGDTVDVEFTTTANSVFQGWAGDTSKTNGLTATVSVTGDINITARVLRNYNLTVSTQGLGTVHGSEGLYLSGSTVALTALPDTIRSWQFSKWAGDLNSSNQMVEFVMDSDKNVIAEFTKADGKFTVAGALFGDLGTCRESNRYDIWG